jgi:hypothetical protein
MKKLVVSMMLVSLCVFGCAGPYPANANYTARSCTSAIHCQKDEVCFTYEVSMVGQERGAKPWVDGYCGKLASE